MATETLTITIRAQDRASQELQQLRQALNELEQPKTIPIELRHELGELERELERVLGDPRTVEIALARDEWDTFRRDLEQPLQTRVEVDISDGERAARDLGQRFERELQQAVDVVSNVTVNVEAVGGGAGGGGVVDSALQLFGAGPGGGRTVRLSDLPPLPGAPLPGAAVSAAPLSPRQAARVARAGLGGAAIGGAADAAAEVLRHTFRSARSIAGRNVLIHQEEYFPGTTGIGGVALGNVLAETASLGYDPEVGPAIPSSFFERSAAGGAFLNPYFAEQVGPAVPFRAALEESPANPFGGFFDDFFSFGTGFEGERPGLAEFESLLTEEGLDPAEFTGEGLQPVGQAVEPITIGAIGVAAAAARRVFRGVRDLARYAGVRVRPGSRADQLQRRAQDIIRTPANRDVQRRAGQLQRDFQEYARQLQREGIPSGGGAGAGGALPPVTAGGEVVRRGTGTVRRGTLAGEAAATRAAQARQAAEAARRRAQAGELQESFGQFARQQRQRSEALGEAAGQRAADAARPFVEARRAAQQAGRRRFGAGAAATAVAGGAVAYEFLDVGTGLPEEELSGTAAAAAVAGAREEVRRRSEDLLGGTEEQRTEAYDRLSQITGLSRAQAERYLTILAEGDPRLVDDAAELFLLYQNALTDQELGVPPSPDEVLRAIFEGTREEGAAFSFAERGGVPAGFVDLVSLPTIYGRFSREAGLDPSLTVAFDDIRGGTELGRSITREAIETGVQRAGPQVRQRAISNQLENLARQLQRQSSETTDARLIGRLEAARTFAESGDVRGATTRAISAVREAQQSGALDPGLLNIRQAAQQLQQLTEADFEAARGVLGDLVRPYQRPEIDLTRTDATQEERRADVDNIRAQADRREGQRLFDEALSGSGFTRQQVHTEVQRVEGITPDEMARLAAQEPGAAAQILQGALDRLDRARRERQRGRDRAARRRLERLQAESPFNVRGRRSFLSEAAFGFDAPLDDVLRFYGAADFGDDGGAGLFTDADFTFDNFGQDLFTDRDFDFGLGQRQVQTFQSPADRAFFQSLALGAPGVGGAAFRGGFGRGVGQLVASSAGAYAGTAIGAAIGGPAGAALGGLAGGAVEGLLTEANEWLSGIFGNTQDQFARLRNRPIGIGERGGVYGQRQRGIEDPEDLEPDAPGARSTRITVTPPEERPAPTVNVQVTGTFNVFGEPNDFTEQVSETLKPIITEAVLEAEDLGTVSVSSSVAHRGITR